MTPVNTRAFLVLTLVVAGCRVAVGPNGSASDDAVRIFVGPNHEALSGSADPQYHEGWIAASPTERNLLVAVSKTGRGGCANSVSVDGGNRWETLPLVGSDDCFDPMTVPGIDGRMHILHTGTRAASEAVPGSGKREVPVKIFTSNDHGKSWSGPVELRTTTGPDHPRMTVDRTSGPRRGRIYVAWNEGGDLLIPNRYHLYLHYSDDHGATFTDPMLIAFDSGGKLVITEPIILSDGTLLVTYFKFFFPVFSNNRNDRKPFFLLRSNDGGRTFAPPEKALEIGMGSADYETGSEPYFVLPIVAVDDSETSRYRDRIYVVWHDAATGEPNIWLSWSADGGRSWSGKVRVNDNAAARVKGRLSARMYPVVAVNKDGVVGVAWYDRRDDPALRCWKAYFAASLDGGETFRPNIPVSSARSCPAKNGAPVVQVKNAVPEPPLPFTQDTVEQLMATKRYLEAEQLLHTLRRGAAIDGMGRTGLRLTFDPGIEPYPGDYMGLAADVSGAFHALWVDTRTGSSHQDLYSARIEVETGRERPASRLQERDVTERVEVQVTARSFDEDSGVVSLQVALRNVSQDPIYGPLRLRVSAVRRGGDGEVLVDPDGAETGEGGFWDFTGLVGTRGRLEPGDISEPRAVKLRVRREEGLDLELEFEIGGRIRQGP